MQVQQKKRGWGDMSKSQEKKHFLYELINSNDQSDNKDI